MRPPDPSGVALCSATSLRTERRTRRKESPLRRWKVIVRLSRGYARAGKARLESLRVPIQPIRKPRSGNECSRRLQSSNQDRLEGFGLAMEAKVQLSSRLRIHRAGEKRSETNRAVLRSVESRYFLRTARPVERRSQPERAISEGKPPRVSADS